MPSPPLVLTEDLAHLFLGALLTVCRADGDVNPDETEALEHAAATMLRLARFDNEALLCSDVTALELAAAIHRGSGHAFRAYAISPPVDVGRAFVAAARLVGEADGELNALEIQSIRGFARALGCGVAEVGL